MAKSCVQDGKTRGALGVPVRGAQPSQEAKTGGAGDGRLNKTTTTGGKGDKPCDPTFICPHVLTAVFTGINE